MKINLISAGWGHIGWGTEIAFKRGLEYLGHKTICIDPNGLDQNSLDMQADATVVFKEVFHQEIQTQLLNFAGPKLVYQPDDMRFPHIRESMTCMRTFCDHAVIFEPDGVQTALDLGYRSATRIMLPVDTMIYREVPVPKVLDLCFIGNISNEPGHASRRRMAELVQKMKYKSIIMSSFNISQVVHLYNSSKIVLHHATDVGQPFGTGFGYQSRHFEAGFSGACVLSNRIMNEKVIPGLETFSSEDEFAATIVDLLETNLYVDSAKMYTHMLQANHRPENRAQELVDFIKSRV